MSQTTTLTKEAKEMALGNELFDLFNNPHKSDDFVKSAAETIINETPFIRRRIRENAFHPSILEPKPVVQAMLTPQVYLEEPVVLGEMEAGQRGAKAMPFDDGADIDTYFFAKFYTRFRKFTTPEFRKSVYNLMSYKNDLRKFITENSLRDMDAEQDKAFIDEMDEIVGSVGGVGPSGLEQNFAITGPITRKSYSSIDRTMKQRKLNPGIALLNRITPEAFRNFTFEEMGGDKSQEVLTDDVMTINGNNQEFKFFKIPHIATIKNELVADDVVYLFTQQDYLGVSLELQSPTMYVKREKDILISQAECRWGFTIANVVGVEKRQWNS